MKNLKQSSVRLGFLDAIRGVSSLLVVLSHLIGEFIPSFSLGSNYRRHFPDPGLIGVIAFFLVSGFIIPFSLERIGSVKAFLVNRFFRIYPLYFVIFVLALILYIFNIGGEWSALKLNLTSNILFHIFLIQDYLPQEKYNIVYLVLGSWTLPLEIIWYLVYACIYSINMNKKSNSLLLLANIFILLLCFFAFFFKLRIINNRILLVFCSFIGLYIYRYFNKEINAKTFALLMIVSCGTILLAVFIGFSMFTNPFFNFASIVGSYSIAFGIFAFFYIFHEKINKKIERIFAFLGRISYSFYLGHGLVLFTVLHFMGQKGWLSITTILFFSIVWAYILFTYIETPAIGWGKKVVKKITEKDKMHVLVNNN